MYSQIALYLFVHASHIEELLSEISICRVEVEKLNEKSDAVCATVEGASDSAEKAFINMLLFILSMEEGHWRKVVNSLFKYVYNILDKSLTFDRLCIPCFFYFFLQSK